MGLGLKRWLWLLPLFWAALVSSDDPKKEVLVKEVVLDSAVVDIVYLGKSHEAVLVTTKNKRLYFSNDSGKSWTETTALVDKNDKAEIQVERIIVNPTDKTVAILQTQRRLRASGDGAGRWYPYIYITEDSGNSWRRAWGKHHGMHNWIAHPTERAWALVSWWSGNCAADKVKKIEKAPDPEDDDDSDKACVHRLMVTTDLGRNFLQLAEYVVQFSWGTVESGQAYRVYFTGYRTQTGDQGRLSLWTTQVDFKHIDFFKTGRPKGNVVTDLKHGNKFLISGPYIMVARVKDEASQTVNLMVSKDGGSTFKAALLPSGMGELEEKWYTVLDTSEGAVILHINNDASGLKDTGRIFISDDEGYKFAQSLVNNVRSAHGECEFDKVISLNGVYLSNIVVAGAGNSPDQGFAKGVQKAQEEMESEAAGGAEVDVKHGRGGLMGQKPAKGGKEERTIRTVISFDKGGAWSYLKAPRVNSLGKVYDCNGKPPEECSLHLHGTTSWDFYAPFYSSETAIGIIMGTGNVGSSLRFEPEETNTYLSRDGGLTWSEAHQGAYIYEFGDHGGIIVMADDLKQTSMVLFTWNEGQSWYDFKVGTTAFEVDNIITEPNVTATTFIMFGTRAGGEGVLYYLNFDALQFPACKGVWAADSVSSDYENWTPTDGSSTENCMLGQQLTYTRRKRTSQCWNGEKFERPVVQKKCTCSQSDFMCDVGFTRTVGSTECVFGGMEMMPTSFIPQLCVGTFQASAYRKIAGDVCEGGWAPAPVMLQCPSRSFGSDTYTYIGAACVVAVLLYMFCGSGGSKKGGISFDAGAAKGFCQDCSPMVIIQIPLLAFSWAYESLASRSGARFKYEKVKGDDTGLDFDGFDGNGGTSLSDFMAEADFDDAPRVYDGSVAESSVRERNTGILSGGLSVAREAVPKLAAPAKIGGGQHFDMSGGDDADLL